VTAGAAWLIIGFNARSSRGAKSIWLPRVSTNTRSAQDQTRHPHPQGFALYFPRVPFVLLQPAKLLIDVTSGVPFAPTGARPQGHLTAVLTPGPL
jgi:hypothetical protein